MIEQHKTIASFEIKHLNDKGFLKGYASVFHVKDGQGDIILPGAFAKTLQEGATSKQQAKMLWQHDPKMPIGRWDLMREDAHGLYVEGQMFLDLEKGREAHTLMKEGVIDSLSIGFQLLKAKRNAEQARQIEEVKLFEISLVTFPANAEARITEYKDLSKASDKTTLLASIQRARNTLNCA